MLFYVDYILSDCENENEVGKVYSFLSTEFEITNLGDVNYFLGMEITKENGKYGIPLQSYIERTTDKLSLGDTW